MLISVFSLKMLGLLRPARLDDPFVRAITLASHNVPQSNERTVMEPKADSIESDSMVSNAGNTLSRRAILYG